MKFVTMGDAKYFETILLSIAQSVRYYPGRNFFLYDWGFESDQLEQLMSFPGVQVINWRDRLIDVNQVFSQERALKTFVKKHILRHPDIIRPKELWQREFLLDEKCYCILDAVIRTDGPLLFLDADAFIVNRVDDLVNTDSDVVVTLRPLVEIEAAKRRGSRHDVNSGVIFFNDNKTKIIAFIIEWIKEMNMLNLKRHPLSEQTGLSNLVLRGNIDDFFEDRRDVEVMIGDLLIRCRIVSTVHYNYNSVEDGFDPDVNRILHLKSGRAFNGALAEVLDKLEKHKLEKTNNDEFHKD